MKIQLTAKKYKSEGDLAHEYNPLHNKFSKEGKIEDFTTDEIDINLSKPVDIECQPSYDGTVNLIINDDMNPPRIINTTYSVIEDNKYRRIVRNQTEQTNLYREGKIDAQTRLFRNINKIPKVDLMDVSYHGQLKGGNYTFYFKLADNDYNKTDIVAESGLVSVFKGTIEKIHSISGTLEDERTDKSINFSLTNIDTSFSKVFVYYRRDYSDLNGVIKSETCALKTPYKIVGSAMLLSIDGFEEVDHINQEELNIKYNICTGVKSQAQVQNMLFFGNVQQTVIKNDELQNISYFIEASCKQKEISIGYIEPKNYYIQPGANTGKSEYYNPLNIYYSLGYWPDELYRMGIVYIFLDDSLSPVYNLRGCKFAENNMENFVYGEGDLSSLYKHEEGKDKKLVNINNEDFFLSTNSYLTNTKGVFKFPKLHPINYKENEHSVNPIGITFTINNEVLDELQKYYKVKGFFFVRQKRIPTILGEGFTVGVDKSSYIPMLFNDTVDKKITDIKDSDRWGKLKDDDTQFPDGYYFAESFINNSKILTTSYEDRIIKTSTKQCSGLLCLDAIVNKQLQSMFDNSEFLLEEEHRFNLFRNGMIRSYYANPSIMDSGNKTLSKLIYIQTDIPLRYLDDYGYSTRCGSSEEAKDFRFLESRNFAVDNTKIVRGIYCSFVGTNQNLNNNSLYLIRISNYSQTYETNYFKIRGNDLSPFMAISPRYELNDKELKKPYQLNKKVISQRLIEGTWKTESEVNTIIENDVIVINRDLYKDSIIIDGVVKIITVYSLINNIRSIVPDVYRGDCFTSTVTIKINTNFIDSDVPTNDLIVSPETWKNSYEGYSDTSIEKWKDMNRADINTVPMGQWITYKCLSNYNLGLRSENRQNTEEMSLMGNPRSFYPLQGMTTAPVSKIPESELLNAGYSTSLPFKKYFTIPNVPYVKDIFDTRIMFSDVQIEDDFRSAYRIFQGLAYKDIERQYGSIVKLLPLGSNLFCVFEHGCAIIPINEKALLATTTGQSIHMYGAGVLQNQVTPISPDYGSIWQESVIRTPNGIYGIDTFAKKIWRYNQVEGFKIISDMIVQRFLNDNIILNESDKYPTISLKNAKTHYNNYKGDIMFTFYNRDKVWNLCYNERLQKWISKYSWTPLASENINNIFLSLDRKRASLYGIIYDNINTESGIHVEDRNKSFGRACGNLWEYDNVTRTLVMKGYEFFDKFNIRITSITSSLLDNQGIEQQVIFTETPRENSMDIPCKILNAKDISWSQYLIGEYDKESIPKYIRIYQEGKNLKLEVSKCKETDKLIYLKIDFEVTPNLDSLDKSENGEGEKLPIDNAENHSSQTNQNKIRANGNSVIESIVLVRDIEDKNTNIDLYEKLLRNGFYVHGRAGIFNEINYFDDDLDNEILPTKWYNKQEPFEFEFVVNTPIGIHKIFDNLVLISNNVEPNSLEFEFIGDIYDFNKAGIYKAEHVNADKYWNANGTFNNIGYKKEQLDNEFSQNSKNSKNSTMFNKRQVEINKDIVTGQYYLKINQHLKNIKTNGRRLGNIEYKEDRWLTTIDPIYYYNKQKDANDKLYLSDLKSTRVRDKWVKIRIKYTGDKLVIINAIQSLLRLSYA